MHLRGNPLFLNRGIYDSFPVHYDARDGSQPPSWLCRFGKSYRIAGYLPSERGLMTKYHSEFITLQLIGCQYKVCAFLENANRSHRKFLHFSKMQTIAVLFLWVTC